MSLKEKINEDIKKAMKEKNETLLLVLRGINAAIKNKEIEKKPSSKTGEEELNDEEVMGILVSESKKRKDAIEQFKQGGRDDLVEKEQKELGIIKDYLPEQMSEENIREEAKKVIEEIGAVGPSDTGKVMGVIMPKLKGKADGGLVGKIVGELLKGD